MGSLFGWYDKREWGLCYLMSVFSSWFWSKSQMKRTSSSAEPEIGPLSFRETPRERRVYYRTPDTSPRHLPIQAIPAMHDRRPLSISVVGDSHDG